MNAAQLARALRANAESVMEAEDSIVPTDRLPTGRERAHSQHLKVSAELTLVLARLLEGKPVAKAFGAPGDWGYDTLVGKALAADGPWTLPPETSS